MLTILFLYLQLLYNEAGRPYAEGKGKNCAKFDYPSVLGKNKKSKPVADPRFHKRGH